MSDTPMTWEGFMHFMEVLAVNARGEEIADKRWMPFVESAQSNLTDIIQAVIGEEIGTALKETNEAFCQKLDAKLEEIKAAIAAAKPSGPTVASKPEAPEPQVVSIPQPPPIGILGKRKPASKPAAAAADEPPARPTDTPQEPPATAGKAEAPGFLLKDLSEVTDWQAAMDAAYDAIKDAAAAAGVDFDHSAPVPSELGTEAKAITYLQKRVARREMTADAGIEFAQTIPGWTSEMTPTSRILWSLRQQNLDLANKQVVVGGKRTSPYDVVHTLIESGQVTDVEGLKKVLDENKLDWIVSYDPDRVTMANALRGKRQSEEEQALHDAGRLGKPNGNKGKDSRRRK